MDETLCLASRNSSDPKKDPLRARDPRPAFQTESLPSSLLVLVENGPNSLDIHGIGTTFRSYVACWNLYDRLLTFGRKTLPDGGLSYDHTNIEPKLAEDFTLSPEAMSVTFNLRRGATFHDGAPVTAEDVKWLLDRVTSVKLVEIRD